MAQFEKTKTVALTPENKKALQDILQVQIESQEDCAVCLETLHNPVRYQKPAQSMCAACADLLYYLGHHHLRSQLWQRVHYSSH